MTISVLAKICENTRRALNIQYCCAGMEKFPSWRKQNIFWCTRLMHSAFKCFSRTDSFQKTLVLFASLWKLSILTFGNHTYWTNDKQRGYIFSVFTLVDFIKSAGQNSLEWLPAIFYHMSCKTMSRDVQHVRKCRSCISTVYRLVLFWKVQTLLNSLETMIFGKHVVNYFKLYI